MSCLCPLQVIGQEEAVSAIARAIRRARVGLSEYMQSEAWAEAEKPAVLLHIAIH